MVTSTAPNVACRGGLVPVKNADGSVYSGSGRPYYYASSATALYLGDLVVVDGNSNQVAVVASGGGVYGAVGCPIGSLPTVVRTTNGAHASTGVVVSVGLDPSGTMGGANYVPVSKACVVFIEDNKGVLYEIQSNGAASSHTYADIEANANVTGSGGVTQTGRSSIQLDQGSLTTGSTTQLVIKGVSRRINASDMTQANPCFYVKLNNVTEANNTAGF